MLGPCKIEENDQKLMQSSLFSLGPSRCHKQDLYKWLLRIVFEDSWSGAMYKILGVLDKEWRWSLIIRQFFLKIILLGMTSKFQIYPEMFWSVCILLFLLLWTWAYMEVPFQISGPYHCYFLIYGKPWV